MKTSITSIFLLSLALACSSGLQAQLLKKLGKRAERAAQRTIERRVDQEASKKTDEVLDSILEPGKKGKQMPETPNPSEDDSDSGTVSSGNSSTKKVASGSTQPLKVYSKFDFVPGDEMLFFDDFTSDFMGDFPAKWNTNGGGEVVTIDGSPNRWYAINSGSFTVPNVSTPLPEDFTIEFDLRYLNLTRQTSSNINTWFIVSETANLSNKDPYVMTDLNPCPWIAVGPQIRNYFPGDSDPIRNTMKRDLREAFKEEIHISIAVNKNRYRFWVNENKIFDVPQLVKDPSKLNYFKIFMRGINEQAGERLLISNLKIAKGGVDLRRKLLAEGKISTNGILFDSGSANIKPESMGIIRQIYQVLQQDSAIGLTIVGHTDSDGSAGSNLELSKERAAAVKNTLVSVYGVDQGRLSVDGKGAAEPVADNNTVDGKAQNRRVEFIKK